MSDLLHDQAPKASGPVECLGQTFPSKVTHKAIMRYILHYTQPGFVRHNFPVPMSTHEFQAGLTQRFAGRDGMVFFADQVEEYDRKRAQVAQALQMEMFVSDERSAIDRLTDFMKRRPSTYQEVHTDFISQLGAAWKKHESKPELAALLEDNFIQKDYATIISIANKLPVDTLQEDEKLLRIYDNALTRTEEN